MKTCSDCPFMKKSPLAGSTEWLRDVMTSSINDQFFMHTCHKTDPNADGFSGAKKIRECRGHLKIIMNDADKTPGKDGVYNSIEEMARSYMAFWGIHIPASARMVSVLREK